MSVLPNHLLDAVDRYMFKPAIKWANDIKYKDHWHSRHQWLGKDEYCYENSGLPQLALGRHSFDGTSSSKLF